MWDLNSRFQNIFKYVLVDKVDYEPGRSLADKSVF